MENDGLSKIGTCGCSHCHDENNDKHARHGEHNETEERGHGQCTRAGAEAHACSPGPRDFGTVIQIIAAVIFAAFGAFAEHVFILEYFFSVLKFPFSTVCYIAAFAIAGWQVILTALRGITRGHLFDENFLMSLAGICAIAIGEHLEAAAVMILFKIGGALEGYAVNKSRKNVADLMNIRPDTAEVLRGDQQLRVSPKDVRAGETIVILAGAKIPLDCEVTGGQSEVDMSAMTGESVPLSVSVGSPLLSGTVNKSGRLTAVVTKPYGEDAASRVLKLVSEASERKSKTENFITKFSKVYTPAVCAAALLTAVIPPVFFHADPREFIRRALVFLVCSCPCALVISVPLGFFGGIGRGSKEGFLLKGSMYFEPLANIEALLLDKTGTVTKGRFGVSEIKAKEGTDAVPHLLETAASALSQSTHPLARTVTQYCGENFKAVNAIENVAEHHGKGVSAINPKGIKILCGSETFLRENGVFVSFSPSGTTVHVSENKTYLGYIAFADCVKESSAEAISKLRKLGVKHIAMLTGDSESSAKAAARAVGINESEVHSGLLPEDKLNLLRKYKAETKRGAVAFAGDGINDAPVLMESDIGIAMGGIGSDSAIESADLVIMNDDLSVIAAAIVTARRTRAVVKQNIAFSLAVKFSVQVLGLLGIAAMWAAVFADVGVTILAVLNAASIFVRTKK